MRRRLLQAETVAVGLLILLLAGQRLLRLDLDPHADELALIAGGGVVDALIAPENGVNPPLLHVLASALPTAWALTWGRVGAWLAGLATLGSLAVLARRTVGDTPGAALAAVLALGVLPQHVAVGTMLRSYAFWGLAWTAHAALLSRALEDDARARRAWLGTLILTGWLHYAALPLAVLELAWLATAGPAGRSLLRLTPWLALAWAPLAIPVVQHAVVRTRTSPPAEVLELLLTAGLGERTTGPLLPALVLLPLGVGLLRWRQAAPATRLALVASVGSLALLPLLGTQQAVRTQATVLFAVPWALAVATLPLPGVAGALLRLGLAGAVAGLVAPHATEGRIRAEDPRAWHAVVEDWPRWRADGALWLVDDAEVVTLCYVVAGVREYAHGSPEAACAGEAFCCVHDGVVVRRVRTPPAPGWLVTPRRTLPWTPPEGCAAQATPARYAEARCGDTAGEGP
ncbi:MAG: hypothetical protein H6732_00595 [Alphaproteobacteria bacterium]|nr:hypothetical protein [Alphaproteobacteria bacterium]